MEEIMQSNSFFIIPLTIAYLSVCGLWFLFDKKKLAWPVEPIESPTKPWWEMGLALVACVVILAIGQLYSAGFLIPKSSEQWLNHVIWIINNFIIFSPIFMVLILRKQKLNTIFISARDILRKISFGTLASIIGVVLFIGIRGEWYRIIEVLEYSIKADALANFPATFFENVALAFLFVRLKWALGIRWAIIIPAVVFAFAHVPGSLAEGDSRSHIMTFFILTGSLTTVILYTAYRSRDIIWLGVVHYFMDLAIKAF